MPKSQIIKDIVEDKESIEKSMTRLYVLAKDIKNGQIELWAKQELEGYQNTNDVPDYRKFTSDMIRYSGINGNFQVNGAALPAGVIDAEHYEQIRKVVICDGLSIVSEFTSNDSSPRKDLSWMASEISNNTKGQISCSSIEQIIPQTFFKKIISEVKNIMITILCELEKEYGNLDGLVIDVSKIEPMVVEDNNNRINRAVFNISIPEKKEPLFLKVTWNIVVPIIAAIAGAIISAVVIKIFGL